MSLKQNQFYSPPPHPSSSASLQQLIVAERGNICIFATTLDHAADEILKKLNILLKSSTPGIKASNSQNISWEPMKV
jgi:hypothetical protein